MNHHSNIKATVAFFCDYPAGPAGPIVIVLACSFCSAQSRHAHAVLKDGAWGRFVFEAFGWPAEVAALSVSGGSGHSLSCAGHSGEKSCIPKVTPGHSIAKAMILRPLSFFPPVVVPDRAPDCRPLLSRSRPGRPVSLDQADCFRAAANLLLARKVALPLVPNRSHVLRQSRRPNGRAPRAAVGRYSLERDAQGASEAIRLEEKPWALVAHT